MSREPFQKNEASALVRPCEMRIYRRLAYCARTQCCSHRWGAMHNRGKPTVGVALLLLNEGHDGRSTESGWHTHLGLSLERFALSGPACERMNCSGAAEQYFAIQWLTDSKNIRAESGVYSAIAVGKGTRVPWKYKLKDFRAVAILQECASCSRAHQTSQVMHGGCFCMPFRSASCVAACTVGHSNFSAALSPPAVLEFDLLEEKLSAIHPGGQKLKLCCLWGCILPL